MVFDEPPGTRISSFLHSVRDVDVSADLVRNEELGSLLNFSDCESSFEEFQRLASDLSQLSWSTLPIDSQDEIWNTLLEFRNYYRDIRNFSSIDKGIDERDELARQFNAGFDKLKLTVAPFLAYLFWESGDLQSRRADLDETIMDANRSLEAAAQEMSSKLSAADDVLGALRDLSAEAGVGERAATFSKAAERYEQLSAQWLKRAIISAGATIVLALLLVVVWEVEGPISEAGTLQVVLAKAGALAVLSFATITAVRLFRSNAHLAAVNRHREDALRTFMTFVEGAGSVDTKDKVLLAAAHAAFGQTSTGLIGDRVDGNNALELVDGIAGGLIRRRS